MSDREDHNFGELLSVKYCEPAIAESILSGEVWLRPHSYYREAEAKNGLMSDNEEGVLYRYLGSGRQEMGKPLYVGGIKMVENTVYGAAPGVGGLTAQAEVDEFLLCLSNGPYNQTHHDKMMHGCPNYPDYVPEPKYTNFIVFDIPTLSECLISWAGAIFGASYLGQHLCNYGDRSKEITDSEKYTGRADPAFGIWTKPTRLQIENERRIALKIISRPTSGKNDVLQIKCPALHSAIVAFGEFHG